MGNRPKMIADKMPPRGLSPDPNVQLGFALGEAPGGFPVVLMQIDMRGRRDVAALSPDMVARVTNQLVDLLGQIDARTGGPS